MSPMSNSKKKSKSIRVHTFRINHRSSAPDYTANPLHNRPEMLPTGTVRSLGTRQPQTPDITPVQLSNDYEAVQASTTTILAETVVSFFSFEAVMTSSDLQQRYYVVLLPDRYKDQSEAKRLKARLEEVLQQGPLNLLLLYGDVGQQSSCDPLNPYRYAEVECGASIGPADGGWSGSFGGYLKDVNTGEVWGLTCGHNICVHDYATPGLSPDQLVEFLPDGHEILQPSVPDRFYQLAQVQELLLMYEKRLAAMIQKQHPNSPPSYGFLKIQQKVREAEAEKAILENDDKCKFAKKTAIAELVVDDGILWDYALLEITQPDRQGSNRMGMTLLEQSSLDLRDPPEDRVQTVGRTSGPSKGTFRGFLGNGKVERISLPFRCLYTYGKGQSMSELGDSGSWIRYKSMAVGYIFGGGTTEEVPLCTTWVSDLNMVRERIRKKWGKDLIVYTG